MVEPGTYHIHFNGIVQGVGFRPAVYHVAIEMELEGYVKNDSNGVNIIFNALEQQAELFFGKLQQALPLRAVVVSGTICKVAPQFFTGFSILTDDKDGELAADKDTPGNPVYLSPDISICKDCLAELHDVNSRRYRYAFITCTQCGPRYSIINNLPYERHHTAMERFRLCESCDQEYFSVADRRFFSQTNSCPDCGPTLSLFERSLFLDTAVLMSKDTESILSDIKVYLQEGKILAVKGIGGYLLLCDANNVEAIQRLRKRKNRALKPFAVLYPDMESIEDDFEVSQQEKDLLESAVAPIVLLYPQQGALTHLAINAIAPALNRIGVMMPYNALFDLIVRDYGKPLVATSGNLSGSAIIYQDKDALHYLFDIADYIVSHDRAITVPQDDSVVQVSTYSGQLIILRRSRGYAPSFLGYKAKSDQCILSAGAFLKSSFTLAMNGNVFVSQFLGNSKTFEAQTMYKNTLKHWLLLYMVKPDVMVADRHQGYFSHQYARELATKMRCDLKLVAHHEAHFAAVLAENNLLDTKEAVLGVIWDGTGLGNDGNIWGGEFFKYHDHEMLRSCHFDYFPSIAGNLVATQPRIAALCVSNCIAPLTDDLLKKKFTTIEWNNYKTLIENTSLFTSSVGRIFDAAASLLDLCDKQTYEGEAALSLQQLAEDYVAVNGFVMVGGYLDGKSASESLSAAWLIQGIITDLENGRAKNYIAARFHYSFVCLIDKVATNLRVKHICFSGGVFQNALLIDWIKNKLGARFALCFHQYLSPNDENISFGQLVYEDNKINGNIGKINQVTI